MPNNRYKYLLIVSLVILLVNSILIFSIISFSRSVYAIFFYHVAAAWLSYISYGASFISHILYLKKKEMKWSYHGKNSVVIGVVFSAFTIITGSLWYNATSGGYQNIYWQWSDYRQTMTLVLFFSYFSYLIYRKSVEEPNQKAKVSALLGLVLFPLVPLSYFSAIIFTSLHPLITPNPGQSGHIYWDFLKIFSLLLNLIAITIFYVYNMNELYKNDITRYKLKELIQRKLSED